VVEKDEGANIKLQGWVEAFVYDKEGRLKTYTMFASINPGIYVPKGVMPETIGLYYFRRNVITNVGLSAITQLTFGLGSAPFKYIAIGTGTNAESVTDTALQNEIARKQAGITQTTTLISGDTAVLEATFSSSDNLSGTITITEIGVFNASSGGTLLARKVISGIPVNFTAGDSITIRYYIQMSR